MNGSLQLNLKTTRDAVPDQPNPGEPHRRFTDAELRELNIRAGESFARMFLRTVEVQQQGKNMTMPHLMNCSHSDDGWCLDCVKELNDGANRKIDEWYSAYMEFLGVVYAAGEWHAKRINDEQFRRVIADYKARHP